MFGGVAKFLSPNEHNKIACKYRTLFKSFCFFPFKTPNYIVNLIAGNMSDMLYAYENVVEYKNECHRRRITTDK